MSLTPKQQLEQVNNPNLLSILSTIQGLPTQESLKHGAYVWKCYQYTPEETLTNPSFTANVQTLSTQGIIDITGADFDLTKIKDYKNFFVGFNNGGAKPQFNLSSNELYLMDSRGNSHKVTSYIPNMQVDGVIQRLLLQDSLPSEDVGITTFSYSGTKTFPEEKKFLDLVVSDDPTAYPDGGEQDGYWYEKVVEGIPLPSGFTKYAVDKFTPTSRTVARSVTLPHSLGEVPKAYILVPKTESRAAEADLWYASGFSKGSAVTELKNSSVLVRFSASAQAPDLVGSVNTTFSDTSLIVYYSYAYFVAGVEYTLITMA